MTEFDTSLIQLLNDDIKKQQLPASFLNTILQWLLPIAEAINTVRLAKNKPIIISFNGAQGSGKSTITHFIALLLTHYFKQRTIAISIDNFYLSKQQRLQLSKKIHPLLQTRGVPGTHDINLAISTLKKLSLCSSHNPCFIPQFNKATDDQTKKGEWFKIEEPMEIILFEGWCNHAPSQNKNELTLAINTLEKEEDTDGKWRHYVNEQLKLYQKELFSQCDQLYFIKTPNFENVYEWRGLQEDKLALSSKKEIMDTKKLTRFIQHFERITRQCLKTLPQRADVIIELDDKHNIKTITHHSP